MKDEYGTPITMMVQHRWRYSIPNHGQVNHLLYEQAFYDYKLLRENYTDSGLSIHLDAEKAERFAKHNNLTLVTPLEVELYWKKYDEDYSSGT